jgi:hypothetical protein
MKFIARAGHPGKQLANLRIVKTLLGLECRNAALSHSGELLECAQTKTPWGCPHGVFEKPGDTYFRECSHYHRPGVLNYCVRNGNRCFHYGMVARKSAGGGKTRPHLTFWLFEQEWHDPCETCELRFPMLEERRSRQSDIFNLQSNISQSSALTLPNCKLG